MQVRWKYSILHCEMSDMLKSAIEGLRAGTHATVETLHNILKVEGIFMRAASTELVLLVLIIILIGTISPSRIAKVLRGLTGSVREL